MIARRKGHEIRPGCPRAAGGGGARRPSPGRQDHLAHQITEGTSSLYLDLESRADRDKLAEPALFLKEYEDHLVVLDEVHRTPEFFRGLAFRRNFIRTYLERDVPQFGLRIPAETLGRLWTMLAHNQGALLNASRLASGLSVSAPTVTGYIDLLVDLLLVRRLPPFHANIGKRLVKSPKTYVRDSGLVHALLGIDDYNTLAGHPVVGASWESFVIENLLSAAPAGTRAHFYRTAAGAEIDLLLELPGRRGLWAIEIKRGLTTSPGKGFYNAREDLRPRRSFIVHSGDERYPVTKDITAIGLREMASFLRARDAAESRRAGKLD